MSAMNLSSGVHMSRRHHLDRDCVLQQISHGLKGPVRAEDTVARVGGDEFNVLQTHALHESEAEMLGEIIGK